MGMGRPGCARTAGTLAASRARSLIMVDETTCSAMPQTVCRLSHYRASPSGWVKQGRSADVADVQQSTVETTPSRSHSVPPLVSCGGGSEEMKEMMMDITPGAPRATRPEPYPIVEHYFYLSEI